jgi:hypothetical protein
MPLNSRGNPASAFTGFQSSGTIEPGGALAFQIVGLIYLTYQNLSTGGPIILLFPTAYNLVGF